MVKNSGIRIRPLFNWIARSWLKPVYDGAGSISIGFGALNVRASSLEIRTIGRQSASEFFRAKMNSTLPLASRSRSGSITFMLPMFSCSVNFSPHVRPLSFETRAEMRDGAQSLPLALL